MHQCTLFLVCALATAFDEVTESCSSDATERCTAGSSVAASNDDSSLMQTQVQSQLLSRTGDLAQHVKRPRDLVLMHVPYNFGHTIEAVALWQPQLAKATAFDASAYELFANPTKRPSELDWKHIASVATAGSELWGHLNPKLQKMEEVTGCPMYFAPQKYWPEDLAKEYFGNKTIFGVIRDPFERLVAEFRGNMDNYGGFGTKDDHAECRMNKAIKERMQEILNDPKAIFSGSCGNVPQVEYFKGPYAIQIPVDNWLFPQSANKLLSEHGYPFHIRQQDIMHVHGCYEHWSQELDEETKSLVRQVYKDDFDLLCKSFGYCDYEQDTCLQGVETMCPPTVFQWDAEKEIACPKDGKQSGNIRVRPECH